jgi:hypothetical protein
MRAKVYIPLLLLVSASTPAETIDSPDLRQVTTAGPLLRRELPAYRNFALRPYTNYPDHSPPYADHPQAFYSSLGNHLITGYEIYNWHETRQPGQQFGSRMFKDFNVWRPVFDHAMIGRDGYGDWGIAAIVGDGLIARFTPLTLSKVDFNGLRFDLDRPGLKLTVLASRLERQPTSNFLAPWSFGGSTFSASNTMLLGARTELSVGALRLGFNAVNMHLFESNRKGNSFKGLVRPNTPLVEWILLRVSDDSPRDGHGGPVVQELKLLVDGTPRSDLLVGVVKHVDGARTQVGRVSQATGGFTPTIYNTARPVNGNTGYPFYRGREIPLYADYIYRLQHEDGADVSGNTNLPGLLQAFDAQNSREILRADGDQQLVYLFDLTAEPSVQSIEVEAIIGNDYRIDVATVFEINDRGRNVESQFRGNYYETVLRARGNIQDLSNLGRVRFHVGENTGLLVYGSDASLDWAGFQLHGEYARSSLYARFPAHEEGQRRFRDSPRFRRSDPAYYVHLLRWFGRARLGGEYFAHYPRYTTELRSYLASDRSYSWGDQAGLTNQTIYWRLVQDNEDGDRYPDIPHGHNISAGRNITTVDPTGVFPGQDEDQDGWPDTNRNFNEIPDYSEPFLMFYVEPNEYVYGLDRNNNTEPDVREDDRDVDYPYDPDQRGFHLFAHMDLNQHWSAGAGRQRVGEIAGSGRTHATYALLNYRRQGVARIRHVFFENHIRRVKDTIEDEYVLVDEAPNHGRVRAGDGGLEVTVFSNFGSIEQDDPLVFQNSLVNDTYLEGVFNPLPSLYLTQKLRLQLNWQKAGRIPGGAAQRRRRLDFSTSVSRLHYALHFGRLEVSPQLKLLYLKLTDRDADRQSNGGYSGRDLRSEYHVIPILRIEYSLLERTTVRLGIQGLGPWPYRLKDGVRSQESLERRTATLTLSNRSRYFGYDLHTVVGIGRDRREFDDPFRGDADFDRLNIFVRALIGFTEYGVLL